MDVERANRNNAETTKQSTTLAKGHLAEFFVQDRAANNDQDIGADVFQWGNYGSVKMLQT